MSRNEIIEKITDLWSTVSQDVIEDAKDILDEEGFEYEQYRCFLDVFEKDEDEPFASFELVQAGACTYILAPVDL